MASYDDDLLYKEQFETYIMEFCRVVNGETSVTQLAPIIELLKTSQIIKYLMTDPTNEAAKTCIRDYMATRRIPPDFLNKLLTIITMKINITANAVNYINKTFTAKVIYNNVQPTSQLTNLTVSSRVAELNEEAKKAVPYEKTRRQPTQVIKLKLNSDTLPSCINAIDDLDRTIVEGNRANGREMNHFVKTTFK